MSMYPLTCAGGFPNPVKAGKMEFLGVQATSKQINQPSRITLIDDRGISPDAKYGRILDSGSVATVQICDKRVEDNVNGMIEWYPPEPIKLRNGISVLRADNIEAGSLKVFVK